MLKKQAGKEGVDPSFGWNYQTHFFLLFLLSNKNL